MQSKREIEFAESKKVRQSYMHYLMPNCNGSRTRTHSRYTDTHAYTHKCLTRRGSEKENAKLVIRQLLWLIKCNKLAWCRVVGYALVFFVFSVLVTEQLVSTFGNGLRCSLNEKMRLNIHGNESEREMPRCTK